MPKKKAFRSQSGFTLLEIIFVMSIVGFLASVSLPKYQSIQDDAAEEACQYVVAAGLSACSSEYHSLLLQSGGQPNTIATADICTGANDQIIVSDDVTVTITTSGDDCEVLAEHERGRSAIDIWSRP